MTNADRSRQGLLAGVASYGLWGLMPLYWRLIAFASPLEILAQRIVWSFLLVAGVLAALRTPWRRLLVTALDRRYAPRLVAAAVFISVNWLTYIVAVNSGHVVEASLGYFINPLVNVLFGVLLFGEKLGLGGRVGGGLALLGVAIIAAGSWSTLWISLLLAGSFGLYGVFKKKLHLPAAEGLLVETGILLPFAAAYVGFLAATGGATFGRSAGESLLLALLGPATALPLWLFAVAATRLPLGVLGVLQYLAPTLQFIMGVTLFGEHVTASYWVGLVLVWTGSAVYLALTLRAARSAGAATGPH